MKVALVHESLTTLGGAERVLKECSRVFADAPIYTLLARPEHAARYSIVHSSFLQRLPLPLRGRFLWPLYAIAPETFDLSAYDVIVSSSSAFAKGIVTRPGSFHVCYCHSPTRFLWDCYHEAGGALSGAVPRGLFRFASHPLRMWDAAAARRVDQFIANSETTRQRIRKYYHRDATVIYPPVSVRHPERSEGSTRTRKKSYFLFVGRLSLYKRADLVIQTFNKLELPLVVAGQGRALRDLRRLADRNITFRPEVTDEELPALYAGARALVFPSDDDFGIVPVEAMASGTPVLALRRGGAMETIIEGVTGEFFDEPMEELLADCVRRFLEMERAYESAVLRSHADQFSAERFRREIKTFVERAWDDWRTARALTEVDAEQGVVRVLKRASISARGLSR